MWVSVAGVCRVVVHMRVCVSACGCIYVWVGCAWGVCDLCGGIFVFVGAWGMVFVGGGGSLGGSVLHMGLAHGICFSFRALRLPHEFQI